MSREQRWISVEERLPEKSDEYIVVEDGEKFAESADWNGSEWVTVRTYGQDSEQRTLYNVTHWMPFPELPAGDSGAPEKPTGWIPVTDTDKLPKHGTSVLITYGAGPWVTLADFEWGFDSKPEFGLGFGKGFAWDVTHWMEPPEPAGDSPSAPAQGLTGLPCAVCGQWPCKPDCAATSRTAPAQYTPHTPECSYWKENVCNCGQREHAKRVAAPEGETPLLLTAQDEIDYLEGRVRVLEDAVHGCVEAMEIQEKRDTEAFHLSAEAFRPMWDQALSQARSSLAAERKGRATKTETSTTVTNACKSPVASPSAAATEREAFEKWQRDNPVRIGAAIRKTPGDYEWDGWEARAAWQASSRGDGSMLAKRLQHWKERTESAEGQLAALREAANTLIRLHDGNGSEALRLGAWKRLGALSAAEPGAQEVKK